MLLDQLPVNIDALLAHDGFEMQFHVFITRVLWEDKLFSIPGNTLIVTATAGLGGHQLDCVRSRYDFPRAVVKVDFLSLWDITQMKAPFWVEAPDQSACVFQGEETGNGSFLCMDAYGGNENINE